MKLEKESGSNMFPFYISYNILLTARFVKKIGMRHKQELFFWMARLKWETN